MNDEVQPYVVAAANDRYEVQSVSGRVVMSCRDEASARHYAVILCDAYTAGFKKGYKLAKSE